MLPTVSTDCPYCGESIDLIIDDSIEQQNYIEDCFVCCRPINVIITIDQDAEITVVCRSENEI